jgi:hypothetical protein
MPRLPAEKPSRSDASTNGGPKTQQTSTYVRSAGRCESRSLGAYLRTRRAGNTLMAAGNRTASNTWMTPFVVSRSAKMMFPTLALGLRRRCQVVHRPRGVGALVARTAIAAPGVTHCTVVSKVFVAVVVAAAAENAQHGGESPSSPPSPIVALSWLLPACPTPLRSAGSQIGELSTFVHARETSTGGLPHSDVVGEIATALSCLRESPVHRTSRAHYSDCGNDTAHV